MAKQTWAWVTRARASLIGAIEVYNRLATARERHFLEHARLMRQLQPHTPGLPDLSQVLDACERLVIASIPAPISDEEWRAIGERHRETTELLAGVLLLIDMLCDDCKTRIEESGVMQVASDADLAAAFGGIMRLIDRLTTQGTAQRRRGLGILATIAESGQHTEIDTSKDGDPILQHRGVTAGYVKEDAG